MKNVSSPPTRYAHSGDASIAYQTLGDGPCDLVLVTGPASHMELLWVHRGREVAALIPGARFIERDGDDASGWLDPTWLTDVEEFLTGRRSGDQDERRRLSRDVRRSGAGRPLASMSGPACTPASARCATTTWPGSPCTLPRGDHVLRGVPDPWRLYALER